MINAILSNFALNACTCLNPVLCVAGLGVTIWVALITKRKAYLVIGAYFAVALYALTAAPYINRIVAERRYYDLSEETRRAMDAAIREAADQVLEKAGHPPMAMRVSVNVRLDLILVVLGVCLLGAQDIAVVRKDGGQSERRMYGAVLGLLAVGLMFVAYRAFIHDTHWDPPGHKEVETKWVVSPFSVALAAGFGIVSVRLLKTKKTGAEPEVQKVSSEAAPNTSSGEPST